jgi:3-hydroxyisobutyrate dehydrogenase
MGISIGWIGLGRMGLPMATRLVTAGFPVRGFDIDDASCRRFLDASGTASPSPASAADGAEFVITMLPDGDAVRAAIVDGHEPAIRTMKPGTIVIDMSSSSPIQTKALGHSLRAQGFGLIDAPVSGGVQKAIDGSLTIMVGGEPSIVARAVPVLRCMGQSIFETGTLGSGHAVKALNNYVSCAGLIAACEAIRIAEAFGIDPGKVVDVLNASTGRNNSTEKKLKQHVLSRRFASGFGLALMAKDVHIAAELAENLYLNAPLSCEVDRLAADALAALGPASDLTEIDRHRG